MLISPTTFPLEITKHDFFFCLFTPVNILAPLKVGLIYKYGTKDLQCVHDSLKRIFSRELAHLNDTFRYELEFDLLVREPVIDDVRALTTELHHNEVSNFYQSLPFGLDVYIIIFFLVYSYQTRPKKMNRQLKSRAIRRLPFQKLLHRCVRGGRYSFP